MMDKCREQKKGKWGQNYGLSYFEEKVSKCKERNSKQIEKKIKSKVVGYIRRKSKEERPEGSAEINELTSWKWLVDIAKECFPPYVSSYL